MAEEEPEIHLRDYLRVVRKRIWTVFAFFVVAVVTVTVATFKMEPIYRATVQLEIGKENMKVLQIEEMIPVDATHTDYYQTQYKLFKSRSLAEKIVQATDFQKVQERRPKTLSLRAVVGKALNAVLTKLGAQEDKGGEDEEPDYIEIFLDKVAVEPIRNSRLVDIHIEDPDPEMAERLTNTLANMYIEDGMRKRLETYKTAEGWLGERAEVLQQKLTKSEQALQKFLNENSLVSMGTLGESQNIELQKLSQTSARRTECHQEIKQLELLRRSLKEGRKIGDDLLFATPVFAKNVVLQELRKKQIELEGERSRLAKVYLDEHPSMAALDSQIENVSEKIQGETQGVLASLDSEYENLKKEEASLQENLDAQTRVIQKLQTQAREFQILERDVKKNQVFFDTLLKRARETELATGLDDLASNIRVVDPAEVPRKPVRPRKALNILLALIVGLAGGIGLAFFFEYLDNTIKTPEDIEQHIKLPFLGFVPAISSKNGALTRDLVTHVDKKSVAAEAYRSIRTNILFSSPDKELKLVMVTSSGPREGKTTTAINIAIAMAQTGSRVLLVDADMRRPRVHKSLELKNEAGLSNVLIGDMPLPEAAQQSQVERLEIVPCGPTPPNPAELLGSNRMKEFLKEASEAYDRVVFDSPPVMAVTDACILGSMVDGVVQVVHAGTTSRDVAARGRDQLQSVGVKILGSVLNNVRTSGGDYYSSPYYHYRYYSDYYEDGGGRKKRRKK